MLAIHWKGDLSVAENELLQDSSGSGSKGLTTWARAWILTLKRKFPEALQVLQQFRGETLLVSARLPRGRRLFWRVSSYLYQGDKEKARLGVRARADRCGAACA